jgi:hypothetical protein
VLVIGHMAQVLLVLEDVEPEVVVLPGTEAAVAAIRIDGQNGFARFLGDHSCNVQGGCGFADTAFIPADCDERHESPFCT